MLNCTQGGLSSLGQGVHFQSASIPASLVLNLASTADATHTSVNVLQNRIKATCKKQRTYKLHLHHSWTGPEQPFVRTQECCTTDLY